ncbi:IucA/IucC family protein [Halobacillus kuroshimensis]|uniref:IucA/IucC family protein n=1 Tax=Halobacillus kuroshimensis TaxID=302481 RepID=UPI000427DA27|nr:IucA/IucC family protein [Halobacillus kuroshimensis]
MIPTDLHTMPRPIFEEEKCLEFLTTSYPELVSYFHKHRDNGRKGILHKLADSILRENIQGMYQTARKVEVERGTLLADGIPVSEEPLYKGLKNQPLEEGRDYLFICRGDYGVLFPIRRVSAFQMIETAEGILFVSSEGCRRVESAADLLHLLFSVEDFPNLFPFTRELNNGTANLTMALAFDEVWKDGVKKEAHNLGADTLFSYLASKRGSGFSPGLFFEQLVVEGHHLHPGAKTKLGLSYPDVFRFSPEFHQPFTIRFAAVRRSALVMTETGLEEYFTDQATAARRELADKGYEAGEYEVVPVHPWQMENALPVIYENEIKSGVVVLLDQPYLDAEATSSFRTVAPRGNEPVMKLAVNSQMTSTIRSISMQTAMNSTVFSRLIQDIYEKESDMKSFVPLMELSGAAFKSDDRLKSRNLTMLLREDIDHHLEDEEWAVAGMALYAESPISGRTVLRDIIEELSRCENLTIAEASESFFKSYVEKVLPGYLKLMVKYGIALEGHLQNSIPVFKNGRLSRFFFRDWGGSRIYTDRLRSRGHTPAFAADSVSVTNNLSDMHHKLYYTVFQNHLGEIIRQLSEWTNAGETWFWDVVKQQCEQILDELAVDEASDKAVKEDRDFLYQPVVMHKSLTKMRLTNSQGYGYNEVPNPLGRQVVEE